MKIVSGAMAIAGLMVAYPALAVAPKAGSYAANITVGQVKGTGCIDSSGTQFAGVMTYSGISGTSDYLKAAVIYNGSPLISVQHLTVDSGVGTLMPSGTFTWSGTSADGQQWSVSGTFSATLYEVDPSSFIALVAESYPSCTEHQAIGLVRAAR